MEHCRCFEKISRQSASQQRKLPWQTQGLFTGCLIGMRRIDFIHRWKWVFGKVQASARNCGERLCALMEPRPLHAVQDHKHYQQQNMREPDRSGCFALLPACVKILNNKWVLISKVALSVYLHHAPCLPATRISTGERHLSPSFPLSLSPIYFLKCILTTEAWISSSSVHCGKEAHRVMLIFS